MREIENPMSVDSLWPQEPKSIGECAGCGKDIYTYEDYYDMQDKEENVIVHQSEECCVDYVADRSICRSPGE